MARITFVKAAQQRYETKPVIDPATGQQKRTPVMRKDGTQKVSKRGPVFMDVTERDLTRPKPLLDCDACGKPIEIGTPYKHVTPKSGPYGGYQRSRHAACPTWKPWDLSNAWWARVAQVVDEFDVGNAVSPDDVTDALSSLADEVRSLAEESREAADNIRDGFGHDTFTSEEADNRADELESWADEIENVDVPELPEAEAEDCDECGGTGSVDCDDDFHNGTEPEQETETCDECGGAPADPQQIDCGECSGSGQAEAGDEPTDEQMEAWLEEVQSACDDVIGNSPV